MKRSVTILGLRAGVYLRHFANELHEYRLQALLVKYEKCYHCMLKDKVKV